MQQQAVFISGTAKARHFGPGRAIEQILCMNRAPAASLKSSFAIADPYPMSTRLRNTVRTDEAYDAICWKFGKDRALPKSLLMADQQKPSEDLKVDGTFGEVTSTFPVRRVFCLLAR